MASKEMSLASSLVRSIPLARRKASARTFGLSAIFVIGLSIVGLISLLYLAQMSAVATAGYDIKNLQDQQARWQMRNGQLATDIAQLQSLERVSADAKTRLNMGPPTKVLYLAVDSRLIDGDTSSASNDTNIPLDANVDNNKSSGKSSDGSSWLDALRRGLGL